MLVAVTAAAQSGVLLPKNKQISDPTVLSLEDMRIRVVIEDGDAHVSITQVFSNHTNAIEEGTYRFALPGEASVSDFAVWDGPVRIPAVILERKRAEEIYDEARLQAIDPGLLSMNERSDTDPRETALFSAEIMPIPPFGTKRLELEYHQRLTVAEFKQRFLLPLRPEAGEQQGARHVHLDFELHSAIPLTGFEAPGLKVTASDDHMVQASFDRGPGLLDQDVAASWRLVDLAAGQLTILTHRDPATSLRSAAEPHAGKLDTAPEPGFFEAQLLVAEPAGSS
ncbi:MAG: VIT domain-containing protein, partial [Janthinobacterium lividum]